MTCREVEHVATPKGSAARAERGGTGRTDTAEPLTQRPRRVGRPGHSLAGRGRWAELSGGRTPGGAARQRHGLGLGGALQSRGPASRPAAAWRTLAPIRRGGAAAHPGGSPAASGSRTRWHGDMVLEHAATGLALRRRWAGAGEHLYNLEDAARGRSELATEPDLV